MKGTTGFSIALAGALVATPAWAADEDRQAWLSTNATGTVLPGVTGLLEASYRLRSDDPEQLLTRASVETAVGHGMALSGGVAYVEFAGGYELRPHQQVTVASGPVVFRTRVEQQFFHGADRMQLRLRQRVQVVQPLGPATKATFSGELLYIARSQTQGSSARRDQWRAMASLQQRLSRHIEGSAGYLAIYSPRDGRADRLSHVAQLSLTFRP